MLSSFGKLVSNYEFQHTIFTVSKYELKNSHEFGNSPVANSTVKIQVGSFKMHQLTSVTGRPFGRRQLRQHVGARQRFRGSPQKGTARYGRVLRSFPRFRPDQMPIRLSTGR